MHAGADRATARHEGGSRLEQGFQIAGPGRVGHHRAGSRNDDQAHAVMDPPSAQDPRGDRQVVGPRIGARADEDLMHRSSRRLAHGHAAILAPRQGDHRLQTAQVDRQFPRIRGIRVGMDGFVVELRPRAQEIGGCRIERKDAGLGAELRSHVAKREAFRR